MKPFSLLIKPASADCNLACQYCFYLDHCHMFPETKQHRMSIETLQSMTRSYMQTPQPQYIFAWQGGEPTMMGLDFFKEATRLQTDLARPGATVCNGLQTNATLIDDAMAAHFAEYKFLLGVSLDGPPAIHDHYRKTRGGEGSHAMVWRGIEALRRHGVEFNILVLVSQSNVHRAREVYDYLCENGFLHHQYIPCVEFDAEGKPLPFSINAEEWGGFLNELYDAWRPNDSRRVSIRLFDTLVECFVFGTYNTCTMGKDCRQYFVVEHDGGVYPCDFYVHPDWKLGQIGENAWEAMQAGETYRAFGRRKSKWHRSCDTCDFLSVCSGDCVKHRLRKDTSPRESDPRQRSWLCEGWKTFYSHSLAGIRALAEEVKQERMQPPPGAASAPAQTGAARPNDPCPCGSGKKFKKCCGR